MKTLSACYIWAIRMTTGIDTLFSKSCGRLGSIFLSVGSALRIELKYGHCRVKVFVATFYPGWRSSRAHLRSLWGKQCCVGITCVVSLLLKSGWTDRRWPQTGSILIFLWSILLLKGKIRSFPYFWKFEILDKSTWVHTNSVPIFWTSLFVSFFVSDIVKLFPS